MKNYIKWTVIVSLITTAVSCKKDYLERKPISNLTTENAIYSDESADKAIKGVYAMLRTQKIYGEAYLFMNELASDDITYNEPTQVPIENLTPNSTIELYQNFWLGCYDGVQRANFVIGSLEFSPAVSAEVKKYGKGEAHFLRAYYYWLLTTVYGEIPLYDKLPATFEEIYKQQSSIGEVYNQIYSDLNIAIENLPDSWEGVNKGRVTKYTAMAMLGKAALYQRDWAKAKDYLGQVITSGKFQLNSNYSSNFSESSENGLESIFEIQNYSGLAGPPFGIGFSDGGISGANNYKSVWMGVKNLTGTSNFGQLLATRDLFNEFEPNDKRLRATLWVQNCDRVVTKGGKTYCECNDSIFRGTRLFPYEYGRSTKVGGKTDSIGYYFWVRKNLPGKNKVGLPMDYGNNVPVIRYADVLLMYAEASAESGDLTDAITKLNIVRTRAGLMPFPYTTQFGGHDFKDFVESDGVTYPWLKFSGKQVTYGSSLDDFRKALVHERRVELATEYHRFNDLVRWSYISNHPGSAFEVFKKQGNPTVQTDPEDVKVFSDRNRFSPKPLIEVDKSRGTLIQNSGY